MAVRVLNFELRHLCKSLSQVTVLWWRLILSLDSPPPSTLKKLPRVEFYWRGRGERGVITPPIAHTPRV